MVSILVPTIASVHQPTNPGEYTIASIIQSTSPGECTFASVHQSTSPGESQRFQVKISGQWCDYGPKEDEVLKQQFDKFVGVAKEPTWNKNEHRDAFKEIVIKGRRYVVDFQKMVQVRKDNKKDYKVRPPLQRMDAVSDDSGHECQLGQCDLWLTCEGCEQVYTLRRDASKFDDLDWADCHLCQSCWRPILEKEDKKIEKNQKMRAQVQLQSCKESRPSAKHVPLPSDASTSTTLGAKSAKLHDPLSRPLKDPAKLSTNSVTCTRCDRGFNDKDILYLNIYEQLRPSIVCHEQCFKSFTTLSAQ